MKTVCVESPYSAESFEKGLELDEYARACMVYALGEGTAPFLSHLLYTQVLDDRIPEERALGLEAGFQMGDRCDERWFFVDHGISAGMRMAVDRALRIGQRVEFLHVNR